MASIIQVVAECEIVPLPGGIVQVASKEDGTESSKLEKVETQIANGRTSAMNVLQDASPKGE